MFDAEIKNLWAPWRSPYLSSLTPAAEKADSPDCFLCAYWQYPDNDRENLVLWRTRRSIVLFNRYPYTGGHLLIAPADHVGKLEALSENHLLELMLCARDTQQLLSAVLKPQGFNLGMNINRCAGAGVPDHLHLHVIPRWEGDTNFISTCSDVRVISQSLSDLYQKLHEMAEKLQLPSFSAKE